MRRVGLGLVLGLGLAAGGTGVGWLAAMLEGVGDNPKDIADNGPVDGSAVDQAVLAPEPVADTALLHAAASRTEALDAEIARLRWRISDLRRYCRPAPPATPASSPPVVSDMAPADIARPGMAGPLERPAVDVAAANGAGRPGSQIENPARQETAPPPAERVARQELARTAPTVPPPPPTPERERAPVRVAALEPTPVAVQPPPADPEPALVRPVQRAMLPPPPQQAAMVAPPAPPPLPPPPPEPEPLYRPGQALSVPEEAVQTRDLGFLDGCWLSEPFDNPVNGNSSTKIYCFDAAGNGQMSFRGVDGITCRADVRARWEPGRRLVLEEPQDGTCGSIGPWHRELTGCAIGGDGLARCNSYEFYRRFNYDTRMTRI